MECAVTGDAKGKQEDSHARNSAFYPAFGKEETTAFSFVASDENVYVVTHCDLTKYGVCIVGFKNLPKIARECNLWW